MISTHLTDAGLLRSHFYPLVSLTCDKSRAVILNILLYGYRIRSFMKLKNYTPLPFFNSGLWGYWHCGHSWPIVPASGDSEDDCGEVEECRLAGETEVLGENLPQRHICPSQNPTWPDPGRRGGKPATNRLSYGAASPLPYSANKLYRPRRPPLVGEVSDKFCR
jgi:hypothetical protein